MKPSQVSNKVSSRIKQREGETYGDWTIENFSHVIRTEKSSTYYYNCTCVCGKSQPVALSNLKSKTKGPKGCGCAVSRRNDLTDQQFGCWTVDGYSHTANSQAYWNVTCKCGTQRSISAASLTQGRSQSCGCSRLKKNSLTEDN